MESFDPVRLRQTKQQLSWFKVGGLREQKREPRDVESVGMWSSSGFWDVAAVEWLAKAPKMFVWFGLFDPSVWHYIRNQLPRFPQNRIRER